MERSFFKIPLNQTLAYIYRHPIDWVLHGWKRRRLLKDLHENLLKVRSFNFGVNDNSEARPLQSDCMTMLWNGYFGLKSWYFTTSTAKLENVLRETEAKIDRIEMLRRG